MVESILLPLLVGFIVIAFVAMVAKILALVGDELGFSVPDALAALFIGFVILAVVWLAGSTVIFLLRSFYG